MARRSERRGRPRFTLLVLVLASITVLTLDFRDAAPVRAVRHGAETAFGPFRSVADAAGRPIATTWHGITGYDDLERKNRRLQRRIDRLEGANATKEVDARQLAELRRLLGISFIGDLPRTSARVVSGPLTSFDADLQIDKGSGDGLKEDMPVITQAGLVGRVVSVTGNRSSIRLLTDPQFRFGIKLARSGDIGIAHGQNEDRLVVDDGISGETKVRKGDLVITSGVDQSIFPPDVPVGRVRSVRFTEDRTEQVLEVEPVADLRGLSYVTVLLCDGPCG